MPIGKAVPAAVLGPCHAQLLNLRVRVLPRGEHEHHPIAYAVNLGVDGSADRPLVVRDERRLVRLAAEVDAVVARGMPENPYRLGIVEFTSSLALWQIDAT